MTIARLVDTVVTFGSTTALDHASLDVEPGETVAVVGPSGAGKSTVLLSLAGLIRPTSGRVEVCGTDLVRAPAAVRAHVRLHSIGFVMQGAELMPELSLAENVQLPLRLAGVGASESTRRATALLDLLGVAGAAGRRPAEVSGGQAQRAAVARALVHSPKIVLADEPTGALDSINGRGVMDALLAAVREVGCALLMVTHDLGLAEELSRVVEVRDGRLTQVSVGAVG